MRLLERKLKRGSKKKMNTNVVSFCGVSIWAMFFFIKKIIMRWNL